MHWLILLFVDVLIRPLVIWPIVRMGHAVREFWRRQRSEDWYETSGTVFALRAKQKGRLWRVWAGYHYLAEARRHQGIWARVFVFEREVDDFLRKYRNASIIVRYRPGRVWRSLVLDRDQQRRVLPNTSEKAQTKKASS
jgi:hypothetical protein